MYLKYKTVLFISMFLGVPSRASHFQELLRFQDEFAGQCENFSKLPIHLNTSHKCRYWKIPSEQRWMVSSIAESIEGFIENQAFSVVWFGSSHFTPPPHVRRHTAEKKNNLLPWGGERGEWGAKAYNGEKAWSSMNHKILSDSEKTRTISFLSY
jgi:hypothetical protein